MMHGLQGRRLGEFSFTDGPPSAVGTGVRNVWLGSVGLGLGAAFIAYMMKGNAEAWGYGIGGTAALLGGVSEAISAQNAINVAATTPYSMASSLGHPNQQRVLAIGTAVVGAGIALWGSRR